MPGQNNVADEVSKGIPAEELTGRWKHDPEFLKLPEDQWPKEAPAIEGRSKLDQAKRLRARTVFQVTQANKIEVIPCKKICS